MPLGFAHPAFLVLLAAIPFSIWLARRSLAGLPHGRREAAVILRSAVLVLVALALAGLRIDRRSDRVTAIFLVDRSASIPPDRREALLEFVVTAVERNRAGLDDMAGVIAFGGNAGIEVSPRRDFFFDGFYTVVDPNATDIAGAIRLGAASFPAGAAKRLVLVTDGNETTGRALDEARAAAEQGIAIDAVPVRYLYDPEVMVDKVVVPEALRADEPFDVRAVVSAMRAGRGTLRIFENGRIVDSREVEYGPGKNVYAVTLQRSVSGAYRYEALIESEEDGIPANNVAHGFTSIRGKPRILVCASREGDGPGAERLCRALEEEGLALDVLDPAQLPSSPEAYLGFDAIVLSDVHAADLGGERMDLLHGLVRDIGLGLAVIGGPHAYGAGGYGGTALERALPVSMDLRGRRILPNGALVLIFHTCEFPQGNDWAKRIAKAGIQVLSPRDLVGVLYYGNGEEWLFPLRPADPGTMFPLIDRMFAGDMPDFDRTLVMAEQSLRTAQASVRHAIIISDGDPTPPSAGVMANLVNGGVSVSTVFISSHGGPGNPVYQQGFQLMQSVAGQTGGRFFPLRLAQVGQLPQIFIREATEIRRASIIEETFVPAVAGPSPILRGVGADGIPPLRGYVATTPKDLSDVVLISHREDPVLVTWRYMLGKVVAFTSDATARWAQDWLPWSDYRKFWAQAVRWASRSSDRGGFRIGRMQEGDRTRLVIDALDSEGRFRNYLRIRGRSLDPSRRGESIPFQQIGPGRYAADLRVALPGTYLVHVAWESPDGGSGSFVTGLSVAYSPEFRNLRTQDALLEELARIGGGRFAEPEDVLSGEVNPFRRDLPATVMSREISSTLIALAVWLLLADVFVRRVAVDWGKVWARARARAAILLGRVRPARVPDARLEALLETKARVRDRARRQAYAPEEAAGDGPPADLEAPETRAPAGAGPAAPAPETETAPEEKAKESGYTRRLLDAKRRAIRRGRES